MTIQPTLTGCVNSSTPSPPSCRLMACHCTAIAECHCDLAELWHAHTAVAPQCVAGGVRRVHLLGLVGCGALVTAAPVASFQLLAAGPAWLLCAPAPAPAGQWPSSMAQVHLTTPASHLGLRRSSGEQHHLKCTCAPNVITHHPGALATCHRALMPLSVARSSPATQLNHVWATTHVAGSMPTAKCTLCRASCTGT